MQNPWDQQATESSKSFERFVLYRSLRKLAKDLELNPSTLAETSKKHGWPEGRLLLMHISIKPVNTIKSPKFASWKRRQIALALRAQKVAEKGLKKLLRDMDGGQQLRKLSPEALSKILDTGCRLERLNRDEPEQSLKS